MTISNKKESPKKAADALIEVNKALRNKLRKASTSLKQKSEQIELLNREVCYLSDKQEAQVSTVQKNLQEKVDYYEVENNVLREENENLRTSHSKEDLEKMKKTVSAMKTQLKMAAMHIEGLEAELEAYKQEHFDSKLLKTERLSEGGTTKTFGRVIYEQAFDNRGRAIGVNEPEKYRP